MRGERHLGTLNAMAQHLRAALTVEVDPYADPIAGVIRTSTGADAPFVGWMGLTRGIELALEAARATSVRSPTLRSVQDGR